MPTPVLAERKTRRGRSGNLNARDWPVAISKIRNFRNVAVISPAKSLVEIEEMNEKIAAAAAAKRDKDFLLIARTDARAVESFAKAVERAQSYLGAGADAIFPEALQNEQEFRDFAKEVKAPLLANMTEFGKSPLLSLGQLADLGYRMVIYPQRRSAFRCLQPGRCCAI